MHELLVQESEDSREAADGPCGWVGPSAALGIWDHNLHYYYCHFLVSMF